MSGMYGLSSSVTLNNDIQRRQAMLALYRQIYLRGWLFRTWSRVRKQSPSLLSLAETERDCAMKNSRAAGIQTIPIDQIKGSEERSAEFDAHFTPLKPHLSGKWVDLAVAWSKRISLPPVELIQIGDCYFVRDGHHRISVARAFGQNYIDAVVTVRQMTERPAMQAPQVWANRQVQEFHYAWQGNVSVPQAGG